MMKLTPLKWHLRSLAPWRSRTLWPRLIPLSLEPIMKVAVIVPDDYLGDVIGDLNSRRGQIQGMEALSGSQQVNALFLRPTCSVTPPTCVPRPRAAVSIPWSPATTLRFPRILPRASWLAATRSNTKTKICRGGSSAKFHLKSLDFMVEFSRITLQYICSPELFNKKLKGGQLKWPKS